MKTHGCILFSITLASQSATAFITIINVVRTSYLFRQYPYHLLMNINKIKLTKILHNKSYLLFNLHIRAELPKVSKQELGIGLSIELG